MQQNVIRRKTKDEKKKKSCLTPGRLS